MKNVMAILLALALSMAGFAMAEGSAAGAQIIGRISDMRGDGSFLVAPLDGSQTVRVLVPDGVTYEAAWTLGDGDVVLVSYDGRMTRSLPGQINAQRIASHSVEGFVDQVHEDGDRVLVSSSEIGPVWATLPKGTDAAEYADRTVRIFYSGVMALSYPGQISALTIDEIAVETGNVSEIGKDYFLIERTDDTVRVNFDEHSKVVGDFDVGDAVEVYYSGMMTASLPGQIYGTVIVRIEAQG